MHQQFFALLKKKCTQKERLEVLALLAQEGIQSRELISLRQRQVGPDHITSVAPTLQMLMPQNEHKRAYAQSRKSTDELLTDFGIHPELLRS